MKSTHSGKLERYLGKEKVEELSSLMKGWYGPPIGVQGLPGRVYATRDGDFVGRIEHGYETCFRQHAHDIAQRLKRGARVASGNERARLNAGFASLTDLLEEATKTNKRQELVYSKTDVSGVATASNTLWPTAGTPTAGAAASAAPAGRACNVATTGSMAGLVNAPSGDSLWIVAAQSYSGQPNNTLLVYDRLFDVAKTMNSTATQAVTGVPTRYQSTTVTDPDFIGGNFLFTEIQTVLPATAHNWTVCTYNNQANAGATVPSFAGITSGAAQRLDMPVNTWFAPLAAGDYGIKTLTQMQCSAAVATGAINFVIGHPLVWIPHAIQSQIMAYDYTYTHISLARVLDDACLSFLTPLKGTASATTYTGQLTLVAG